MLISLFCEKYDLKPTNLYVFKSDGKLPAHIFYKPLNSKHMYIDENYFIRRKNFKKRVKRYNEDVYYYLTQYLSILQIVELICKLYPIEPSSVQILLYERLFMVDRSSILSTKISKAEWVLFKYGHLLERNLSKVVGRKVTLSKILDKRAGL